MTNAWTPYKISQIAELLTERDTRILEDLERFRLLNTRLIQRLHFPANADQARTTDMHATESHGTVSYGTESHATVSAATRGTTRVLGRLESHGFISRLERRIGGIKHGSAGTVWQLAAAGERYLRARRGNADRRRFTEPSTTFLAHTLEIAGLATRLIEDARLGHFELLELEPEPECWRDFTGTSGGVLTLKPDLFVVTADTEFETHSFVEIDRGTEHIPAILRKCLAYQQYWQTGSEQHTRNLFPAVVWITTAGRVETLRAAIRGAPELTLDLFHIVTIESALSLLAPTPTTTPKTPEPSTIPKEGTP